MKQNRTSPLPNISRRIRPLMELESTLEAVKAILKDARIPDLKEGLCWGTPGLKVNKKMLLRVKEPDVVVIICSLEEKEMLMKSKPSVFFQTDHYLNSTAVLVRMSEVDPEDFLALAERAGQRMGKKRVGASRPSET